MEEHEITDNELYYRVKRVLKATRGQYLSFLCVGIFFIICGISLTVAALSSVNSFKDYRAVLACSAFIVAALGFGITGTIFALKQLIPYCRDLRILKNGVESTARIFNHDIVHISHFRHSYKPYYSVSLRFYDEVGEKRCKTLHYYNERQYLYLQGKL
ncbi:MAG: hypothetical protein K2O39_03620, partial [Clostridiales bacterium]|nr:hypothetical protein [Clostridiales bacterium]